MFGNSVPLHMNFLNYLSLVVPIYLRPAFILFYFIFSIDGDNVYLWSDDQRHPSSLCH